MNHNPSALFAVSAGLAGLLVAAGCAPMARPVAPAADRGVLVLRLGPDTMFIERFELNPGRIHVESVIRTPRVIFRTLDATLNRDGSFASIRVASTDPANPRGGEVRDSTTITFSADSTFYAFGLGRQKQFLRLAGRGDLVISMPGSYWFPNYILLAARAPRAPGDSMVGTFTSRLGAYPVVVKRQARDTVTVASQLAGSVRLILGADGRTVAYDGTGSSLGYLGTRTEWIDIDSVSRAFAARERASGAVGVLSVRDTVRAIVGGARITVDYGRPSRRGRTIFGNVVPWNQVWRTGANLATHFSTDRALDFSGSVLPAGTYTLYTIPAPEGWTLLVSGETGQWGSAALDPGRVVARIPMRVGRSEDVVEKFTIALVERGSGGALRLAWDGTVAEATFAVR